jgi:hypothetical protein
MLIKHGNLAVIFHVRAVIFHVRDPLVMESSVNGFFLLFFFFTKIRNFMQKVQIAENGQEHQAVKFLRRARLPYISVKFLLRVIFK